MTNLLKKNLLGYRSWHFPCLQAWKLARGDLESLSGPKSGLGQKEISVRKVHCEGVIYCTLGGDSKVPSAVVGTAWIVVHCSVLTISSIVLHCTAQQQNTVLLKCSLIDFNTLLPHISLHHSKPHYTKIHYNTLHPLHPLHTHCSHCTPEARKSARPG